MGRVRVARLAWWKIIAVMLGLGMLVVACGTTTSPGSASASPSAAASASPSVASSVLCADAAALRDSLDKLTHVTVGTNTVNEINADLADVQAKLSTLTAHAETQWSAQTAALKDSMAKLQTAVSDLASKPSAASIGGVVTALGGVSTATQGLLTAIASACPSVSPSPSP